MTTVVIPLCGHPRLKLLSNINQPIITIEYIDIPIYIWISLFENKFLGLYDEIYFEQKYKIKYTPLIIDVVTQLKDCITQFDSIILIVYQPTITTHLWQKLNSIFKHFSNVKVVGLCLNANISSDYILKILRDDFDCNYIQHDISNYLNNHFFLKKPFK